jgi:uncharacterized protein (TIGR02145 family)
MKFKYLLILLFLYDFSMGQVPGTPRLIGRGALSQSYILDLTISNDLNSAIVTGFALNNGQSPVTTCGMVWGTNALLNVNNSATYMGITTNGDITGANSFSADITNLLAQTSTIYIYAYATNSFGTFYSSVRRIQQQTVVTGSGRTWMSYNLGATSIPESVSDTAGYGFLFQWGRKADGHQIVRPVPSGQTIEPNDNPTHGLFILGKAPSSSFWDWRTTRDNNIWNGINAVNNPCPSGFRLPTKAEFENELTYITLKTGAGAFASSLALTYNGERKSGQFQDPGLIRQQGTHGYYWMSDPSLQSDNVAYYIEFTNTSLQVRNSVRTNARAVRCIKHIY